MFQKVDDPWHKTFLQLFDLQIATRVFMACYMMLSFECAYKLLGSTNDSCGKLMDGDLQCLHA
jgi:hypothetical protein